MELFLNILLGALQLASAVSAIIILIDAFQTSVAQGFLCLCIPCYTFHFAFTEFKHEKSELICWLLCGPILLSSIWIIFAGFAGL